MERCEWCDEEYDADDFIDDGVEAPECEPCGRAFCSEKCRAEHAKDCAARPDRFRHLESVSVRS